MADPDIIATDDEGNKLEDDVVLVNGIEPGTGSGGSAVDVLESGTEIVADISDLNFDSYFTVSDSGSGEAKVIIDESTIPVGNLNNVSWQAILEGTDSNKPAAGTAGRYYYATDMNILYRDDGTSWNYVTGQGTSSNPAPGTSHFDSVSTESADITQFQQPAEYIIYQRSGRTYALNSATEYEEFSGSDPGAVIQSAHDAISGGGDILIKSGEYLCDTLPSISTKGVRLVGEGLSWRTTQAATPEAFGTVLRASSNISSTDTLEFAGQFTGMDKIAVDAVSNVNDAITTSSSKDIVISRYGVENAINYNVRCNTSNTWFVGPSWNEFAGVAGLRINSRVEDLWVTDTLFVTNTEHDIEIGANLFNAHINDNHFQLTDAGIRDYGGNTLHELKIENNVFTGIGRDTGNSLNTCVRLESGAKGRITGNVADGEDKDFNQQTDKFVELVGTIDATDLHIEDRGVRSMATATVVDNANQPYHLNGVEIRNSSGATAPNQGFRLIYRRDLSPPEMQAIAANGTTSTLATF